MAEAKRRSSRPPSTATSLWWSSCWSLEPPWRPGTALAAASADQLSHQEMRSLGRTKRTEVRIYIIIIYYIYTCLCSRIYMFFSSSFCFFSVLVLQLCIVMWDVCTVFWFRFLHVIFLFAGYVYHRKKHVPHAEKKTRNMHTNCKIAPQGTCWPLILVCLFFHLCFCMFWIGSMYPGSCLPQKEPWITWQRNITITFRMEIPDWCWGICTLWSCAQEAACGYPWIKPLTRHSFQNCWNLQTSSNIFKSWAKIMWNQWTFHDVSLEARRRCSMLLRGAVSLWSSSSWNLALRWGRRVRTASASTARARGILGRSDGWCMLMFQCITKYIICYRNYIYLSLHRVAFMPNLFWF